MIRPRLVSGTPTVEGFKNATSQSVTLESDAVFCECSSLLMPVPMSKARDGKRQGFETSTSVVHRTRTASIAIPLMIIAVVFDTWVRCDFSLFVDRLLLLSVPTHMSRPSNVETITYGTQPETEP